MKTLLSALAACLVIPSAFATVSYNQTITYINGNGNLNTGWTADTEANGIQLGLRADNRDTGSTASSAPGVYSYAPGNSIAAPTHADWNYQFTINSDSINGTAPLTTYNFYLVMFGPGLVSPVTVNALGNIYFVDDTFGNNGSTQGAGNNSGTGNGLNNGALAGANNVAANSETIAFGPFNDHVNAGGIYTFELYATAANDLRGAGGDKVADVSIQVNVGAVPEPTTVLAGAMLLLPFGASALRIMRKKRTA